MRTLQSDDCINYLRRSDGIRSDSKSPYWLARFLGREGHLMEAREGAKTRRMKHEE